MNPAQLPSGQYRLEHLKRLGLIVDRGNLVHDGQRRTDAQTGRVLPFRIPTSEPEAPPVPYRTRIDKWVAWTAYGAMAAVGAAILALYLTGGMG